MCAQTPPAAEADLVSYREPSARPALEELGSLAWGAALDWLYERGLRNPTANLDAAALKTRYFGPDGAPGVAPETGTPIEDIFEEFAERIAPFAFSSHHPRSFAYFTPPPLPVSIAGEVLAGWLNQSVDIWQAAPSAALVELEVIAWLQEAVGIRDGWGVFTSGGVMANVMALAVARDALLATEGRPRGSALEKARAYASDQAHFSIARGLDLLGFPPSTLRVLPSDDRFRLQPAVLRQAVEEDRAAGFNAFAVVAACGTTNTGSVDPIDALADIADEHGLWLHVDAAYGGAVRLSARDMVRAGNLARADSVTVDPHKWLFQPIDIGALIVRDEGSLRSAFAADPEYYRDVASGSEHLDWYTYSVEGTRPFRALKLWFAWKHLGTRGLADLVEHTIDVAAYLAERCRVEPDLELAVEPDLSVVCFRHRPEASLPASSLDEYQDALQSLLASSGEAWLSTTRLRGRTFLRAGVVNHLSSTDDVDATITALRSLSAAALDRVGRG